MEIITMCFELNFFKNNVKYNVYGQFQKYSRVLPERVFHCHFFSTHIFFVSLKFEANYIIGHWGKFRVKNATLVYT